MVQPQAAAEDEDDVLLVEEDDEDAEDVEEPDDEPDELDDPESELPEELALFETELDEDFERLSVR